jgi:hypothetical protein
MMSGIAKCCAGNPTWGLDDTLGLLIHLHYSGFLFRTQPILSDFSQIVGRAARYYLRLRMFELGERYIDALGFSMHSYAGINPPGLESALLKWKQQSRIGQESRGLIRHINGRLNQN